MTKSPPEGSRGSGANENALDLEEDVRALGLDPEALEKLFLSAADNLPRVGPCACQIAVARWGRLAGFRTFGHAIFQGAGAEATPDTLFSLFSVTKALVASASWILLQEGRLDLAEPVAGRIPEFAANGKGGVTLEHLLLHTAGFPGAELNPLAWEDREARLAKMASWELEWEPGSRFIYHGSSSMWVVAELIERAADQDYREFVRERILEPLGLHDFYLGLPAEQNARVGDVVPVGESASETRKKASKMSIMEISDEDYMRANQPEMRAVGNPGGGGIATAANVALFYQGMLQNASDSAAPEIWKPDMLMEALRDRTGELEDPMTSKAAARGLGVVLATGSKPTDKIFRGFPAACSPRSFGHMGAGGQVAWADPVTGLSYAYCTNAAERDPVHQGARALHLSAQAAGCVRD